MNIFVKPKEGLKVLRPDNGRALDPAGEAVPKNTFWMRRIADGDVVEVASKAEVKAEAKPAYGKKQKDGGDE